MSGNKGLVALLAVLAGVAEAKDIFVSPTGTGTGSQTSPFGSIQSAVNAAAAGDTIYLRNGTYAPSANIQITKSGTASAPIVMKPYEDEKVVLDGENMPGTPKDLGESLPNKERGILHIEGANYWEFYRLELIHGPYGVYARDSSNNYYEELDTHHNYETGFQIQGTSSGNTVTKLLSYLNFDSRKAGESADGFACKEGSGEGNKLTNSRLHSNADDGLDLYMFASPVTMEEVYAYDNGFDRWNVGSSWAGDGNGFKLGIEDGPAANHIVKNCIAFDNIKKGFIDNGNTGSLTFERNTAFGNGDNGFNMRSSSSTLKNNIAVSNDIKDVNLISSTKQTGNSWQSGTWSASSFKSTDSSTLKGARAADGSVMASDFLIPSSGAAIGATTREHL